MPLRVRHFILENGWSRCVGQRWWEGLAKFLHFGREFGAATMHATEADGPLFEPAVAMLADVSVRRAVSAVIEGGFE